MKPEKEIRYDLIVLMIALIMVVVLILFLNYVEPIKPFLK